MTTALTSKMGAIWIQPNGPNFPSYFLDCKDMGDLTIGEGTTTLLQCFDASGIGWKTVGSTIGKPDAISFTVTGLMFKALDWLEKVECPFSLYILLRDCGRADNFSNYLRGFGLPSIHRSQRAYSGLVSREEDVPSVLAVTLDAYPPEMKIEELEVIRKTIAGTEPMNDVAFNTNLQCLGACGDEMDPCQRGMVVGDSAVGPAFALPYQTLDDGDTWTVTVGPFAGVPADAGFHIMSVVRFPIGRTGERYLVGLDAPAGGQGEVSYSDDNGATWTVVTVGGAVAGHGAVYGGGLFALDSRHIWLAGGAGFIYFSDDGGETWAVQDAGAVTATDYNYVHFDPSGQYGIAGAPADVIAVSTDGGSSWQAAGANTGTGDDILCCTMLDNNRAWVGTDEAYLYYTRDGGASWHLRAGWEGSGAGDIRDMAWVNDHVCFMAYDTAVPVGHINHTFDGGYTWSRLVTPANNGLNAITACTTSHAFAVGEILTTAVILEVQPA